MGVIVCKQKTLYPNPQNLIKPKAIDDYTHCGPWLLKSSDIINYPLFPETQKSSLLCKYLTKEVWE